MKMRGLRRKKKTAEDGVLITPTSNNSNSLTPRKQGFRRRIPPHVVITSPLNRLKQRNSSSNTSRAMSALTTDENLTESDLVFVTPEKIPRTLGSMANPTTTTDSSSLMTIEEMGLIDCVVDWFDSVGCLVTSPEMQRFLHSSGHLMFSAGGFAVQTAFLPVTVPFHVASKTTKLIVGQCVGVTQLLLQNHPHETPASQPVLEAEENGPNPLAIVARRAWRLPGHAFGLANRVKDEVGGIVLRTLAPTLHGTIQESCRPGESTSETPNKNSVLERLRLDYSTEETDTKEPAKTSYFLLRVDDLNITHEKKGLLHYVDLNALEDPIVVHSLDRLVYIGLSLIANHPTVRLTNQAQVTPRDLEIEWKPEGSTPKLLRRLSNMDVLERLETLRTDTLVWSGRFKHDVQAGYDRQSHFYLARGVLNMSPRALLDLLWDNGRTADYNRFCLGRTTLAGNDLEFLQGDDKMGTKVIQSETRVPLTSISVTVKCLMHARALPDNTGYVIVSRSCTAGPEGIHHQALKNVSRGKNEILWGVNIIRRVPHHEDLVDLTSHSQVCTAGVPQFLASKIALMGVEGFFETARKLANESLA